MLFRSNRKTHYAYNDIYIDIPALTEEERAAILHMIRNGKGVSPVDRMVLRIVEEEAPAYFTGQKSAEDVRRLIQNRVQLYIGENQ